MLKDGGAPRKMAGRDIGRGIRTAWACLLLLALSAVVVAGCGGSSSSSSSSSTSPAASEAQSFAKYTKDKKIVEFGEEASASDLEAASAVLTQNLEAREAADFKGQCSSLGKEGLKAVVGTVSDESKAKADCPKTLKEIASPLSSTKGPRTNTLSGSIGALRVKGDKAYALYHGTDGKAYAFPMEREDGKWWVGAILATELQ